jgi:hypothetical protein
MDAAERIDAFIDWIHTHGFFLGFLCGAAFVCLLWVI